MSDTPTSGFTEDTALLLFDYLFKKRTPEQLDKAIASMKAGGFPVPTQAIIRTLTNYLTDSLVSREMAVWALIQALDQAVLQSMEPYGGTVSGRWESDGKNVESLDKPKASRVAPPCDIGTED